MLNSKYFQKSFSEQFFVFRPIIYNYQEQNGSFSHCQTGLIILADSYEGAPNYEQHFFAAFFWFIFTDFDRSLRSSAGVGNSAFLLHSTFLSKKKNY
jgi:hypothetical protein